MAMAVVGLAQGMAKLARFGEALPGRDQKAEKDLGAASRKRNSLYSVLLLLTS